MHRNDLKRLLDFSHALYGMKKLLRFKGMPGWEHFTPERWDSVAEHTYRMAMLALQLEPYLKTKVNLSHTLKMILIHDIVELQALDYSPMGKHDNGGGHAFDKQAFQSKYEREIQASQSLFSSLPTEHAQAYQNLFQEYINTKAYPEKGTPEGRYAYALDKIEAVMQIIDWMHEGYTWDASRMEESRRYVTEWTAYEPALTEFVQLLFDEATQHQSQK